MLAEMSGSAATHDAPQQKGGTAVSAGYRRYVLVLLTAVYTFNFIDRQIMGILAPAISKDLGLGDGQLGILMGFAFAVLYTTLGIPIARMADRANRVVVLAISLACWSGFTAISGFAQNFTQLALARVGVGIGEAGGSPPAHSLLSDLYPKEQRAGALAIYALGIPIGITMAYLCGGYVVTHFSWRTTFFVVGLPGVALAILLKLTVREPKRGAVETSHRNDAFAGLKVEHPETLMERFFWAMTRPLGARWGASTFSELTVLWRAAKHLLSIPSYLNVVIGLTAGSFASYAVGSWIVVFFARNHPGLSTYEVLVALGLINGTAYVLGVFFGGRLVDQQARRHRSAYGWIPAIALTLNIPCFLGAMWASDPTISLILWWPAHLLLGFYLGPCFAMVQTLAPVSIRALSTAIFFLF